VCLPHPYRVAHEIMRTTPLKVNLREIAGNWDKGYALDRHKISSTFTGYNDYGHATFDTLRTEAGEATFQLKYRSDWTQVEPLANAIAEHIVPKLPKVSLVIPVPASKVRARQPVYEVSRALAKAIGVETFEGIVSKSVGEGACVALKNLGSKEEKVAALAGRFTITDTITNEGKWNALVVDDLYDTGASLEAVCAALRTYKKIDKIFVATLTWT
jgi:predicted amidophosphoribosyltransferase